MVTKTVRDIMVPIDEYPVISQDATLIDAILKFDESMRRRDRSRQPYRAVLVVDENKKVIGKIGQLAFLKALEPQQNILGDMGKLAAAGVSREFVSSMMKHFQFFQDNLSDLCLRARHLKVRDVMHPVGECIDANAPLGEAISKLVAWQTLSILVTEKDQVVGLLRLSDVCQEVAVEMKKLDGQRENK